MTARTLKADQHLNHAPIASHCGKDVPTLLTVKQFSQRHPAFPEGGLRHRIFHAKSNGLETSGAIVRNLGRVYIDEERFFAWVRGVSV